MQELLNFLMQFGNLNQQQIEFIVSKTTIVDIKKDHPFVKAGKPFNEVIFILEGVLRIFYYNNKDQEITKYFVDENHLLANPYKGEPMTEYIQAITYCKLLVFSEKNWNEISNTIVGWNEIVNNIFHKALLEKMDRRSSLVSEDATTRYLTFLEKFPTLANRVPLSYIASFLGITQQSLSRIRKKTSDETFFTKW
ncbi:Crp/Fnr family transcriptional regulator [Rhizosphaericola mali]|uniref:Crp/Fnr family transcriptional regulator n=1 Tax=Rhizosphaericola mali TaxID=2545455 RepID=A0A5P2G494_9BACT|nr:Crp/Fnr family transcriptional regulator [Rhizosphaericola mali]QES88969.1 Crp/Fnr family transcriptional regulator [Rhizosphaericola mali]